VIEAADPRAGHRRAAGLWLAIAVTLGLLVGLGVFTFGYGEGAAYLTSDPAACMNCHIMRAQFDSWVKSSHHAVAVCNDCHLPHDNPASKLFVKASNGYYHSKAFTLLDFPEPIRIKPSNAKVLEDNCLRCHGELTGEITAHGTLGVPTDPLQKADLYGCVRCHQEVGHGPTR
jgi:cytochrome c nitrite reductase small subunit